jgi:6-phosphogluconolactonase (cycloisomerase 2 family)
MVSMRDDRAFTIESPYRPGICMSADSILTYRIDPDTFELTLVHEFAAGGSFPRQFSLNEAGDRIAVVQQKEGWLSIFERDVETGKIGRLVGIKNGFGDMGPVCVQWDS